MSASTPAWRPAAAGGAPRPPPASAPRRARPPCGRLRIAAAAPPPPQPPRGAAAKAAAAAAAPAAARPPASAPSPQPHHVPAPTAAAAAADQNGDEPLPEHPLLRRGALANGLRWVLLPNPVPPNRFEAHLEIHAGSVDEGPDEQGMAHLVEHVTFLGSRARELLLGTGARSNAYTDFHHTVFHTHAPTAAPDGAPLLGQACAALADVAFTPLFAEARVAKERAAVMSEAQMMNTIEYRVDCQLLAHLHWENALGCRFPIGQMSQISGWPLAALRSFHSRHYFPANATLYLVGDVDPTAALAAISAAFDHIPPSPPPVGFGAAAAAAAAAHAAAVRAGTLPPRVRSPHRPPVVHAYGAPPPPPPPPPAAAAAAPFRLPAPVPGRLVESEGAPRLFAHELLTQFSLSLFCKLPVRPVRTASALAACFAQRVALSVLQARLGRALSSGLARYQTADLDHSDSGREGCAVSTFTVTSEPGDWRAAVAGACAVARRLARRGATPAEFARYKAALLRDSEQLAAQAGTVPSADNLDFVMESDALGHAVMDQLQGHAALAACGEKGVTLEDVNDACAELLGYIADYGLPLLAQPGGGPGGAPGAGGARDPRGGVATAVVVCVPAFLPAGEDDDDDGTTAAKGAPPSPPTPFAITADEVAAALRDHGGPDGGGGAEAVAPLRLVAASDLDARVAALSPHYVPLDGVTPPPFPGWAPPPPPPSGAGTVALRRLSNGATVAWLRSANEPAGASLRLSSSAGGRASEPAAPGPAGVGALALGARALSEVGGCLSHSREELELFAMDRLLTFSVDAGDDSLQLDAHVAVGGGDGGAEGLTAALELLCGMASAPTLDDAAFERARALLSAHVRAAPKSLERATRAAAVRAGLGDDRRFGDPSESDVAALTRPGVLAALAAALGDPARLELAVVGDFDGATLDRLVLRHLGTLQAPRSGVAGGGGDDAAAAFGPLPPSPAPFVMGSAAALAAAAGGGGGGGGGGAAQNKPPPRALRVRLRDSDDRACAFAAGAGPNRWGGSPLQPPPQQQPQPAAAAAVAAAPAPPLPAAAAAPSLPPLFGALPSSSQHDGVGGGGNSGASPAADPRLASDAGLRRAQPLAAAAAQALLCEVVNSRLFTTVRDALGLTYDVSFELAGHTRPGLAAVPQVVGPSMGPSMGPSVGPSAGPSTGPPPPPRPAAPLGWWRLSVTSTPAKVDEALAASLRTLRGLASSRASARELERARTTLLTRHESDAKSDAHLLDGAALAAVKHGCAPPFAGAIAASSSGIVVPAPDARLQSWLADYPALLLATSVEDVQACFEQLALGLGDVVTCVGTAGADAPPPAPPAPPQAPTMQPAAAAAAAVAAVSAAAAAVAGVGVGIGAGAGAGPGAPAPDGFPSPAALQAALAALRGFQRATEGPGGGLPWGER